MTNNARKDRKGRATTPPSPRVYKSTDEFMQAMLPRLHKLRQETRSAGGHSLSARIRRHHVPPTQAGASGASREKMLGLPDSGGE